MKLDRQINGVEATEITMQGISSQRYFPTKAPFLGRTIASLSTENAFSNTNRSFHLITVIFKKILIIMLQMCDLKSSPGIYKVACFREVKQSKVKSKPFSAASTVAVATFRTSRKHLPIYQPLDGCLNSLFCHYPIIGNAEK